VSAGPGLRVAQCTQIDSIWKRILQVFSRVQRPGIDVPLACLGVWVSMRDHLGHSAPAECDKRARMALGASA
jgi:hypothetical protein